VPIALNTRVNSLGPLPRRRERGDGPLLEPPIARVFTVVGKFYGYVRRIFLCFHFGQEFVEQESHIVVTQAVVFVAAIVAIQRNVCIRAFTTPGVTKTPMTIGISFFFVMNEIVEDGGRSSECRPE